MSCSCGKNPGEILSSEHREIEKIISALEKAVAKMRKGENANSKFFSEAIFLIRNFADKCHHAKEEKIFFPALESKGMPKDFGPIGCMLKEHEEGRFFVKSMEDALEKKDKLNIIVNAQYYVQLLKDHISKEDNILFPMSKNFLSNEDEKKLLREFEKVEEKDSKGKHEEFVERINNLEKMIK